MANWILINVPQTTTWSGEAAAYEARNNGVASTGNVTFFPQTTVPLTGADVTSYTSDALFNFANGGPIVVPRSMDLPDLSTPYTATVTSPQDQVTELSFDIAALRTVVEYLTDPSIQASTDWVVSMPTRRYHAAVDYRGPTLITNRGTFGDATSVYFTRLDPIVSPSGASCYRRYALAPFPAAYDREGGSRGYIVPYAQLVTICGVVSVLSAGGETGPSSPTLQASATRTMFHESLFPTDGHVVFSWGWMEGAEGLPVLVRQFSRAVNPSVAPGVSGTFGATWVGRTSLPGVLP